MPHNPPKSFKGFYITLGHVLLRPGKVIGGGGGWGGGEVASSSCQDPSKPLRSSSIFAFQGTKKDLIRDHRSSLGLSLGAT